MNVVLRVDHREPSELKKKLEASAIQSLDFLNLVAGDFEFVDGDTGRTLLLIERKEIEDLCSSLTDGRFDEQKSKLSATNEGNEDNPHPVAYLLEGNYAGHEKAAAIDTVVLTTRFRDGFFMLRTTSIDDTVSTVVRIVDLFTRGKMSPLSDDELHRRFIASRSAHRGGGQFSKNDEWWVVSLGQIPGIGPRAARTIAAQYPTVRSLLDAYNRCKSIKQRRELLQDLKSAGSNRRLGPSASEKVWRCVVGGGGDDRRPYRSAGGGSRKHSNDRKTERPPEVLTECMFVDEDE
jgi:ERCC4-type nuclease